MKYDPDTIGIFELLEYICDCANGSRTVGCCSHIAAVVYYLAHARYLSKILKAAEIFSEMYQQDSIMPVMNHDCDEDLIGLQRTVFVKGERTHDDQTPRFVRCKGAYVQSSTRSVRDGDSR